MYFNFAQCKPQSCQTNCGKQKGQSQILIIGGLLLVMLVAGAYFLGRSQSPKPLQPIAKACTQDAKLCPDGSSVNRVGPNCEFAKCPQVSPISSPYTETWQNYQSGQNIDGITITFPPNWKVNFKKEYNLYSDYTANYRIDFDFAPPGWSSPSSVNWLGWGLLDFDVYNAQTDIQQFIDKNYPSYKDQLIFKKDADIGGKPTFLLTSNKNNYWLPRDIVLGTNHSYEIGHSQNGTSEFVKNIREKSGIFSYIHID